MGVAKLMRRYTWSLSSSLKLMFLMVEMWKGVAMPKMGITTASYFLSAWGKKSRINVSVHEDGEKSNK